MSATPGAAGSAARAAAPTHPPRLALFAVGRAVPALLVGLVSTFTGAHTPQFGLLLVGGWAILDALAGLALLARPGLVDPSTRRLLLVRVLVVGVAGLLAVALSGTGSIALVAVVGIVAAVSGALDLVAGLRARGTSAIARDLIVAGGASLLLAVGALVVPPGFEQPFPGAEGHPGILTAAIVVTGLFGGWAVITGVLWAISAVGLRPARPATPSPAPADGGAGATEDAR
jgi:uncharacterized membrane protein HdeD (DUF308 family)